MQMMTMESMEAEPGYGAGEFVDKLWFKFFLVACEKIVPGSGPYIEAAAAFLPWAKLAKAVAEAFRDFEAGKDWLTIFKEAVADWLVIEPGEPEQPIRMAAKAPTV